MCVKSPGKIERNREVTSRERDEPMINGSSFIRSSLQQIFVPPWLKTRDLEASSSDFDLNLSSRTRRAQGDATEFRAGLRQQCRLSAGRSPHWDRACAGNGVLHVGRNAGLGSPEQHAAKGQTGNVLEEVGVLDGFGGSFAQVKGAWPATSTPGTATGSRFCERKSRIMTAPVFRT